MGFFTKLLFVALSGIDPLIFIAPICLSLGVAFVAALRQLEQIRVRWQGRNNARRLLPKTGASLRQPPSDRQS